VSKWQLFEKNFLIKDLVSQTTKEFFEVMHRIWFG